MIELIDLYAPLIPLWVLILVGGPIALRLASKERQARESKAAQPPSNKTQAPGDPIQESLPFPPSTTTSGSYAGKHAYQQ